jgi:hypothetical protein
MERINDNHNHFGYVIVDAIENDIEFQEEKKTGRTLKAFKTIDDESDYAIAKMLKQFEQKRIELVVNKDGLQGKKRTKCETTIIYYTERIEQLRTIQRERKLFKELEKVINDYNATEREIELLPKMECYDDIAHYYRLIDKQERLYDRKKAIQDKINENTYLAEMAVIQRKTEKDIERLETEKTALISDCIVLEEDIENAIIEHKISGREDNSIIVDMMTKLEKLDDKLNRVKDKLHTIRYGD